jgi:hypothetical protein
LRIVLAYPWTAPDGVRHGPDDVVDAPLPAAKSLLRSGRARVPDTPVVADGLEGLSVPGLRAWAAVRGIDTTGPRKRSDLLAHIRSMIKES